MSDGIAAQVLGSSITLLGVLVALLYSQKNFIVTLQHERQKVIDDREFNARKEAFSNAIEATAGIIQYLVTLPDLKLISGAPMANEVTAFGVAMSRLHCYVNIETLEKTSQAYTSIVDCIADVMRIKIPAMLLDGDIDAARGSIQAWERENDLLHQEIIALLQVDPHGELIKLKRQFLADNHRKLSELHGNVSELSNKKYWAIEACRKSVLRGLPVLQTATNEALIAMRREIGFDIDAARYTAILDTLALRAKKSIESLTQDVHEVMRDNLQ